VKKHSKIVIGFLFFSLMLINSKHSLLATNLILEDADNRLFLQVFERGKFVDNLSLNDLEINLNEQPVEIKGLTLVRGLKIKRVEGEKILSPILPRVLILEYRANDYDQKFGRIVERLFLHPYTPADIISLVTSANSYGFSSQTLRDYSPEQLINAGVTILKRDLSMSGRTYNEIYQEMTQLVLELPHTATPRDVLTQYRQNLENLKTFRLFNETTLLRAAKHFSFLKAQKRYIIIYQQEFLPIPNADTMERLLSNPNTMFLANELFRQVNTGEPLNLEALIQDLTEAGIVLDFLYFRTNPKVRPEFQLKELSLDIYEVYSRLARATGGVVETTAQPSVQLERILEAAENYYLISYSPPAAENLDQFRGEIKLRIKGQRDYSLIFFNL